ncbi:MAG: UvrD-helicase domain-containing protein [Chlamydiales bacterium]
MPGFNVLDPHFDVYTSRFIEASAGTGKTFAIENIVRRLLEEGTRIEEILVVTFTKAATLDLKKRIHQCIGKFTYDFDEANIFTIHGFCYHCLVEHALEADLSLEIKEENKEILLRRVVKDFLRTTDVCSAEQIDKLLRQHQNDIEKLVTTILRIANDRIPIECAPNTFALPEISLAELSELALHFKKTSNRQKTLKEEVKRGFYDYTKRRNLVDSPLLLLKVENRLQKSAVAIPSHITQAVDILEKLSDPLHILSLLCEGARKKIEEFVRANELLFFEDLLRHMEEKVREVAFAEKIRSQYKAVLIDEFQDTNALQWRIFSTLFMQEFRGPLYLVGDPKQAIYRFRHADIYTYLEARNCFTTIEELDCNYRSVPALVRQLNALFAQLPDFISLPKLSSSLPCHPVRFDEQKPDIEEECIKAFSAQSEERLFAEILHLVSYPLQENAVLVKDRYQALRFLEYAHKRGFPAQSRRSRSLLDSLAYPILDHLLQALEHLEKERVLLVLGGPLYALNLLETDLEPYFAQFFRFHTLWKEGGLLSFFHAFEEEEGAHLVARNEELYQDLRQLIEYLSENRLDFDALAQLDPEEVEAQQETQEAIQVLTIHVSKGLEFDNVFPIGLTITTPYKEGLVYSEGRYTASKEANLLHREELEAEKMRQLYVAFTRAKKRLYIPVLEQGEAPIHRFLSRTDCLITPLSDIPEPYFTQERVDLAHPEQVGKIFEASFIHSFSSLYSYEREVTPLSHNERLPIGPEIGTALHTLLQKLAFDAELQSAIPPLLQNTLLAPYEGEVIKMVSKTLQTPLPVIGKPLIAIDPAKMIREMEFLYPIENGYMKGFIDLLFEYDNKFYIIDWKSNIVDDVEEVMKRHHYDKQAEIYRRAVNKYLYLLKKPPCSGCFYIFLRKNNVVFI